MCRHAAYIGPGIALSEILRDLPHSLYHQSFEARELLTGVVCADGYGVAWYDPDSGADAVRYACASPIWSDRNLATMLGRIRSGTVMAAVRNATVAGANIEANCAPFSDGPLSFSHNGFLEDFDTLWRDDLLARLAADDRRRLRGATDSEVIFQLVRAAARERAGSEALVSATQEVCRDLLATADALADEAGRDRVGAHLNLLVSDGQQVVATRLGNGDAQNSLYLLEDGDEFPDGWVVASEPLYDDPEWQVVGPDTVLVLRAGAPPVRLRT